MSPSTSARPRVARSCRGFRAGATRRRCWLSASASADVPSEGTVPAVARRDLAVLELLYGAGLRVSECCGLDVGAVDLRRRTVTVLGKGAKVRRLPLGDPAADAVDAYVRHARASLAGRTDGRALREPAGTAAHAA